MKNIYKYIAGIIGIIGAISCTNLDEHIYSNIPKEEFFSSEEQLVVYSARAYTKLQAWGSEQSLWTLNIQLSDEVAAPKNSVNDWVDPRYKELQTHIIPNSNKLVRMGWDYCFDGIAACNDVIYEIEKSTFEFDGKKTVMAEMKVLRAFFYFCAMDCWGNIPFSIRKDAEGYPEQKDRKFIFDFLVKEINDNIEFLADEPTGEYYGRITQGVAYTLLAKLYLNAEVWIGKPMWAEAEAACKTIIDSGWYSLAENYKDNFKVVNETSKECIFSIPYSTIHTKSDHNDFVIFILTLPPVLCEKYGIPAAGWDGFIAQPDFISTYDEKDIRKAATWIYGQQYDAHGNPIYVITEDVPESRFSEGRPENEGARVGKWEYQSDGLLTSDQTSMDNDFFVFRYADVVLMYVEALVRQTRTSEAAQVEDFKKIRMRAGLEPMTAAELTLENLLMERSHELALEGWKRQDQIRFGTYSRSWWAKPNTTPDHAYILPIPKERLNANPNLNQNPGY